MVTGMYPKPVKNLVITDTEAFSGFSSNIGRITEANVEKLKTGNGG